MAKTRILAVDDEEGMLEVVSDTLCALPDTKVVVERDSEKAAKMLASDQFDLLITDLRMPRMDGIELLRVAREQDPDLSVLMLTAYPSIKTAVESVKLGATDYVTKPFIPDDLLATVRRILKERRLRDENRLLQRHVERKYVFGEIIGRSTAMQKIFETISRIADTDVDVLIYGETGTGKELVARSIHEHSPRAKQRFVPVDCSAIPESLMESEFFGHERGAFTGAHARSIGILEFASGGTFFLDEIGELPPYLQAKLLRVLQERRIRRIGGKDEISIDVRVIAATNRDLDTEVSDGRFRDDLLYRIKVVEIELPPLRDHPEDIPALVEHFVERYARELHRDNVRASPELVEVLSGYPWPGNVRELQNILKRAIVLSRRNLLSVDDLPDQIVLKASKVMSSEGKGFFNLRSRHMASFEKSYLADLLDQHRGDVTKACEDAGMPRGTLYRLLKKHALQADDFRS